MRINEKIALAAFLSMGGVCAQNTCLDCTAGAYDKTHLQTTLHAPAAPGGGAAPVYQTFAEAVPAGTQLTASGLPILHTSPNAKVQICKSPPLPSSSWKVLFILMILPPKGLTVTTLAIIMKSKNSLYLRLSESHIVKTQSTTALKKVAHAMSLLVCVLH